MNNEITKIQEDILNFIEEYYDTGDDYSYILHKAYEELGKDFIDNNRSIFDDVFASYKEGDLMSILEDTIGNALDEISFSLYRKHITKEDLLNYVIKVYEDITNDKR